MQKHIVNRIPASYEQEENQKKIPMHKNKGKLYEELTLENILEESVKTWTD